MKPHLRCGPCVCDHVSCHPSPVAFGGVVRCEPHPLDMGGAPDLPQPPTRSHTLMVENYGRWHSERMVGKRVLPPLLHCPAAGAVTTVCFRPHGYLYTVRLRRPRGTPSLCTCVQTRPLSGSVLHVRIPTGMRALPGSGSHH